MSICTAKRMCEIYAATVAAGGSWDDIAEESGLKVTSARQLVGQIRKATIALFVKNDPTVTEGCSAEVLKAAQTQAKDDVLEKLPHFPRNGGGTGSRSTNLADAAEFLVSQTEDELAAQAEADAEADATADGEDIVSEADADVETELVEA